MGSTTSVDQKGAMAATMEEKGFQCAGGDGYAHRTIGQTRDQEALSVVDADEQTWRAVWQAILLKRRRDKRQERQFPAVAVFLCDGFSRCHRCVSQENRLLRFVRLGGGVVQYPRDRGRPLFTCTRRPMK